MAEKKEAPPVFDFLMSVDCALGHGQLRSINAMWFKDKLGFVGPVSQNGSSYIEKHDLFGGDDGGEGGVSGSVEFYLGGWEQTMSPALAFRYGLTPDTAPGYRGLAHVFFHGGRPPGASGRIAMGATPRHAGSSWDPALGHDFIEISFREEDGYPNYEILQNQIDSGLMTYTAMVERGKGVGGGAWYLGCRVRYYDENDVQIGQGTVNGVNTEGCAEGHLRGISAFLTDPVPPLTRIIRAAHISTISSDECVNESFLELSSGVLVNFFGDNFDQGDLDNLVARGFRWSTHTPWYQGPKFSVTAEPAPLPNMTGVSDEIYPIVDVDENGDYEYASSGDAFERRDRLTNESAFQAIGNRVRDSYLGPDYDRNERFDNENINLERLPDANPALIIWECMTNSDWGRGENVANLDAESYRQAAITLSSERFGISIRWNGQDEIDNFIGVILDHIKALHFRHPVTGLWTLKLLRDDYDTSTALVLDDSNCRIEAANVRGYGEVPNVIKVQYTEAKTGKLESVEGHNLANIAIQGGVVPDTRKYLGIRNRFLAQIVANRDVMEASAPLATAEGVIPRAMAEFIAPGDVVNLTNSRYNLSGFFRVVSMDIGTSQKRDVQIELITDVFSVATIEQSANPTGRIPVADEADPEDINDPAGNSAIAVMSVPYFSLASDPPEAPTQLIALVAADPDRVYEQIDIWGVATDGVGGQTSGRFGRLYETNYASLSTALVAEDTSVIPNDVLESALGLDIETGNRLVIGTTDAEHEIVILDTWDSSEGGYRVIRGAHDTIPRAWPVGTPVFNGTMLSAPFLSQSYVTGDTTSFYLATYANGKTFDYLAATPIDHTVAERAEAPIRPANVSIDGNGFSDTVYVSGAVPDPIPMTWANRNRTMETGTVPRWDDGDITPEAGQTTTIRVWYGAEFDQLETEITGLTGTSHNFDPALLVSANEYEIEFVAVRDGIESYQSYRARLEVTLTGFGYNFGFNYGVT